MSYNNRQKITVQCKELPIYLCVTVGAALSRNTLPSWLAQESVGKRPWR